MENVQANTEQILGSVPITYETGVENVQADTERILGSVPIIYDTFVENVQAYTERILGSVPITYETGVKNLQADTEQIIGNVPITYEPCMENVQANTEPIIGSVPITYETPVENVQFDTEATVENGRKVNESKGKQNEMEEDYSETSIGRSDDDDDDVKYLCWSEKDLSNFKNKEMDMGSYDKVMAKSLRELLTCIGYQLLHTLASGRRTLDFGQSSENGMRNIDPIVINCIAQRYKFSKNNMFYGFSKKYLSDFKMTSRDVSMGISYCITQSIAIYESLVSERVSKLLRLALLYVCKVQRIWKELLRYEIYEHMVIPFRIRMFSSGDLMDSNYLFTNPNIFRMNERANRKISFLLDIPESLPSSTDIEEKCRGWVGSGVSENELMSLRREAMESVCVSFNLPSRKSCKLKYRKTNKLYYMFLKNISVAIQVLWSLRYWYISQNRKDGVCDVLFDICRTICVTKNIFEHNFCLKNV